MAKITNNIEFAEMAINIAKNYKTLYVNGCFGAPMNASNKTRYCNNTSYNKKPERTAMIMAATDDTFGFDCVCLVKGILWGWTGDKTKSYGGASYASNGVPDITEDSMINVCTDVSTDFSKIEVGEYLWMKGHAGIYVGNGLSVECTPSWTNNVQFTACNQTKSGYNRRNWTKHGKLPYITYIPVEQKPKAPYTQEQFIKDVQKILNQTQTGVADDKLLNATVTLSASINNTHALIVPVQKILYALGYTLIGDADGEAGPKFTEAVKAYQKANNCSADGEITAKEKTWKTLLNYTPHTCSYTSKVTKEPTCITEGIKTFTCSCGKSYTEAIPKIAHKYDNGKITTSPTCTKDGVKTFTCSSCKGTYTENIAKLTHKYDAGKITTEATCVKKGIKTFTCACGKTYTEEIPMVAHQYSKKIIAPTCTTDGYTINSCSCGHTFNSDTVKSLGHNYKTNTVAPTYEEKGYDLNTCKICGDSYKDKWINCLIKEEEIEITPPPSEPESSTQPEVEPNIPTPETKPVEPELTPVIPESRPIPEPKPEPIIPQPEPAPSKKESFEMGDTVHLLANSKFTNGVKPQSWVYTSKLYIREFRENESAIIATGKSGPVINIVYLKDLVPYDTIYTAIVIPNLLNVRQGPGANYKIVAQIKRDTKHIILEEKGDWAKIDGLGWASIQYLKKV